MKIPNTRWYRVGLLLFLIYLVAFMDRSNIGMAAPEIAKTFGLSSTAIGVILSTFFWGYVVTQLPGGWAAGKYSAKKVIIIGLLILGSAAIGTGLVHDYHILIALRFIMGLAEGLLWPSFTFFFINWYANSERSRAVSFSEMALPISSLIMAPLAGWMIEHWDYKIMFILQGIPPILLAFLFWWLIADTPEKDRFISEQERDFILRNRTKDEQNKGSILSVILNPRIMVFCLVYFLWITGMYSFGLWLPSLMKQLSNTGIGTVGWLTAIPFLLATLCMYYNAVLADRHIKKRFLFVGIPLCIGGLPLILQAFVGPNLILHMILLIVAGIGIYSAFGPWWAWSMSFVPSHQAGVANGYINLFGNLGGIVGPIIVGTAAKNGNYSFGFLILGLFLILASFITLGIISRLKRTEPQSSKTVNPAINDEPLKTFE